MIQFGNDKIKEIYVGSEPIKEVYYGSELMWRKKEYAQDGYWVHKVTGVKTYFGADADFITDGVMSKPSWATNASEVKIPSEVTSLFRHCFQDCSSLTSINIPEGVTSLGEGCFQYCYSLASVTLSAGLISIGNVCFMNCSSLTSITLPESLTSLGQGSFNACTSLTSITIPAGVTSIGMVCFYQCTKLALAVVLPTIPPTLGEGVFESVHSSLSIKVLYPYVNDYKTATNWSYYASKISGLQDGYWVHKNTGVKTYFGLEEPSIVNGVMSKPSWKLNCSEVKIPSGVTGLNQSCFYNCDALTSVTLPEGVTMLGGGCFSECISLTSITLPESVTYLGEWCFNQCSSLTSINIPEGVTTIGSRSFYQCTSLTLATVLPAIPPYLGTLAFDYTPASNIKVRSPHVNDYKTNWTQYASKISAI